jgi:hypothetical protein
MTRPEPTHTPGALIAEELQMLLRTGRLRTWWDHPPEDAFKGLGIGSDMTPGDWADVNWYGPLEIWRGPEHDVSDILFNGPAHDPFFVVQRGAMVDTGVRVHPDWIAWIQRQLLLRSRKIDPQIEHRLAGAGDARRGRSYALCDHGCTGIALRRLTVDQTPPRNLAYARRSDPGTGALT